MNKLCNYCGQSITGDPKALDLRIIDTHKYYHWSCFDKQFPPEADTEGNDLVLVDRKPTRTHTKSAQSDPKRKANT